MSTCWHCHWGWSKAVHDIYRKYAQIAGEPAMLYGPAHIVWADENFDSAQWCLDHFDEYRDNHGETELAAVKQSLLDLLQVPPNQRNPCPPDYDGSHPENYPPIPGVEMAREMEVGE